MLASNLSVAGLGLLAIPPVPAGAEEAEIGEFELLDYLGSLVEQDGEWLDPMDMDDGGVDDSDEDDLAAAEPDRDQATPPVTEDSP